MGDRGIGLGRAHGYGSNFESYMATANEDICVVVQAEHFHAVENIESIVKVDGLDAILVGPYDLEEAQCLWGRLQLRLHQTNLERRNRHLHRYPSG